MQANTDKVCVVVGRTRHKMVLAELREAAKRGAKLVELRLDFITRAPDFKRLLTDRPCPVVATVRRNTEGGRWGGTEDARKMLLRQAVVAGFDWIDLETDIADQIRRYGKTKRIVSYHNMAETPADLPVIYEKMCQQDPDVVKLAVTAQTPADNLRVLEILRNAKVPTVGHCMGEIGFASRLLALRYNPPFVYAAWNQERGVAPGLPSFDELMNVYEPGRVNAETRVFGVVGDPVAHSRSPLLHNALFRKLEVNGLYVPFRVPRGGLPAFLEAFAAVPVDGYSVTIPHKEAAAKAATVADATVTESGAANTLVRRDGGFFAANTDYQAILDCLSGNDPDTLKGKRVLVLGAGGIARAVAHAVRSRGAQVTVTSRTSERAASLAAQVEGRSVEWTARHGSDCDVLVNGTPVGMHPNVDDSPIHHSYLKPELTVFETVYTPETTLLVKEARARGCTVVTGTELFVRQAALQFRLFTEREAPLELVRGLLKRALSPVALHDEEN